ncbi:nitrous oxide reductase family maturation protein NosD (plasmid) [Halobacterium sp. MBLA0001]|uniref:nitrous oxide reductase family maturation protein NosD n=1 Tax=Halobacterium sp. MBLA0001 TaxID=3413511 RepID=UPI003C758178
MRERRVERALAVLTAALLVVSAGAVVATPGDSAEVGQTLSFDAPVPSEYNFAPPPQAGSVTVDDQRYDTLDAALDAATAGDTLRVFGTVEGPVTVDTAGVTITGSAPSKAVITGDGEETVLTVNASNVTIRNVWVRNAGYSTADNDAAVWLDGANPTVASVRVTNTTFGIWVDGATSATVRDSTIVGRESIDRLSDRGNGIQLWEAHDAVVANNTITDVRDGIYFSWSSSVVARNNTMWDLRYGVHYMYSDDNRLANNTAFNNDVGYALMLSDRLTIVNNTAVNNTGSSGHGILVKSIDHTRIAGNNLVGNDNGLFVYNSLDNTIAGNLVLGNDVGIHLTAGSVRERGYGNSFIRNGNAMKAVIGKQVAWNASDGGNYWADANTVDIDHDGISDVRYQAASVLDRITRRHPTTEVFASSPAFDTVRLASRSVPLVETPGVVDHHPLATPPHDNWRRYYE